jgi:5'-nucleotidase
MSQRDERPLLLLTNDDGIEARGLQILASALGELGRVIVSAPATQQSAVGHGITLGTPLRVLDRGEDRYAVTGRPADSVFIGFGQLCPRTPDLVVSGINHGPNLGVDVLYSGTVAAAMEAATRDIPAIAVSQMLPKLELPAAEGEQRQQVSPWHAPEVPLPELDACLERAARFTVQAARALLARPLSAGMVLNLNAPATPEATGYRWTRLGRQLYEPKAVERRDPRGIPYYWVDGQLTRRLPQPGTDIAAVLEGAFSLTALTLDWTAPAPSAGLSIAGYAEQAQSSEQDEAGR